MLIGPDHHPVADLVILAVSAILMENPMAESHSAPRYPRAKCSWPEHFEDVGSSQSGCTVVDPSLVKVKWVTLSFLKSGIVTREGKWSANRQ